ncbi:NAD-dependent epimerase/dehydratase family protein [Chondrinema litorale]|uniref:NAD-dependent epimerase/dehydratase family protein n=1 Tax=Chondrinema litorale TaxID=2994555 RepID=UPI002543AE38|nr:NAD(P)-dependent oxidoreductase [Chondrinema litorale]UZR99711.1 NAD(P)-dependent oxidoreductase [Chondrinema litorale]
MMKILVTGSSGRLGKEIVKLLRQNNYEVLGTDLVKSETTDEILDIRNLDSVLQITKSIDAIIHTAAIHGKHYELNYPREEFIAANINGTFNLLKACVQNGISKLVYTSTTSIYGEAMVDNSKAVWVTEKLTPIPRDIYDITKLTAELLCKDYFEKEQIETTVLRVSRFLPEIDNLKAIHRLYRGLDEEDGAMAHMLALQKHFDSFEIFNISNHSAFKETDVDMLYQNPKEVILKYYPQAETFFERENWQFPQKIDRVYVIEKAIKLLGYKPAHNFETFLK